MSEFPLIKQFVTDRDAALLSRDLAKITASMRKYGSPELPDSEVGWRAIHKARTGIRNLSADEKQKSKDWLAAHGSAHMDDTP